MSEPQRTETENKGDPGAARIVRDDSLGFSLGPPGDTSKPMTGGTVDFEPPPRPAGPGETMDSSPPDAADDSEPDRVQRTEGNLRGDGLTYAAPDEPQEAVTTEWPTVAGHEILAELGRGGMGVVYKARQIQLDRIVALKMILAGAHAGKDQLARFNTEAQAVAHLQHPNIIQIYDVSEQDGLPFFSLEYVDGGSLADKCGGKPQPVLEAAHMVQLLAGAMHHAHEHNVVHRDLKPANILINSQGIPKITDFGLAKRLEGESSSQTRSGAILGTPSYMAPEQATGEVHQIGPLTDVYALGAMLYELVTGRPPFLAATPMDTVIQVVRDEPVPPSQLQPTLPVDLETICLKCLQKEQPKRYESAEALAEDLRRFLAGEPILARPVSAPERLWRWCRRNPRVASLIASTAVVIVAWAISSTLLAVQISHEKKQTDRERKAAVDARNLADERAKAEAEARGIADLKTEEAQQAQKLADESATIAKTQRKLSLDTLHGVVTKVEEKLRDRSDMSTLRQEVLELAMDGLEKVSKTDDNLAFADRTVGAAHQRMGDILFRAGRVDAAGQQYGKAMVIFEKLLADDPGNDIVRWNIALTFDGLGDVTREKGGDGRIAADYYRKGLELREELLETVKTPELKPAMIQAAIVNSLARLGKVTLNSLCNPAAAARFVDRALEKSQMLAAEHAEFPGAKQSLAGSHFLVGNVKFRLRDAAAARENFTKALELRLEMFRANAASVMAKQNVAATYWGFGDLELQSGAADKALEFYKEAHTLRDELYQKDTDSSEMQWDLSNSFYRLGNAQFALHDVAEARRCYAESLKLREQVAAKDMGNVSKQIDLMLAQARCGLHTEASKAAEELAQGSFLNPGSLYFVAAGFAICAGAVGDGRATEELSAAEQQLREQYADRACAAISQAIDNGFKDAVALETEPDLHFLRSEPRFKSMLRRLAAR